MAEIHAAVEAAIIVADEVAVKMKSFATSPQLRANHEAATDSRDQKATVTLLEEIQWGRWTLQRSSRNKAPRPRTNFSRDAGLLLLSQPPQRLRWSKPNSN